MQEACNNAVAGRLLSLVHRDGQGKRRARHVPGEDTVYWRWDLGYSVLAEYADATPNWDVGALTRFFVPFGHTALAEADLDPSGNPANAVYRYLAHDHLGTSRYGFNQAKTQISAHEHYPYGQRLSASGPAPYHEFTGKPWDPDTKLYYFPYRYYSPGMNRWTTPDPAGLIDGPNVYGYVWGDPLNSFDPLGLLRSRACRTLYASCIFSCSVLWETAMVGVNALLGTLVAACSKSGPLGLTGCMGLAYKIYHGTRRLANLNKQFCFCLCELTYKRCTGYHCDSLGDCEHYRRQRDALVKRLKELWEQFKDGK